MKYFSFIKKYYFILPLIFVVIIKIPHLFVPYFWDEAWSYFPAAFKMYETGPGLLPGALPLWDAKGHPLFFFFISSIWMNLAGTKVAAVHILPLLISLGVIVSVFITLKKIIGETAANIAITLLSVQSLFLAQATMLLPEMLIALFLVLLINSYLSKRYILFAILGSLMVLTKETSIVFILTFAVYHLFISLKPEKESRKYIFESILIIIPLLVYVGFLILHKKEFGSFFFEDHLGYLNFNLTEIRNLLKIALITIFKDFGRIFITISVTFAFIWLLIKKEKIRHKKVIILLSILTIIFISFSVLNFYTERYMLVLIVVFMMLASIIFSQINIRNLILKLAAIALISAIPLYYTFTKKTNHDSNLGYVNTVKVFQQMVDYCEVQGWQDKPISASFNMIFCLKDPHLGYTKQDGFTHVNDLKHYDSSEILIIESTNYEGYDIIELAKKNDRLIKRFENKHAWAEVYIKANPEN